MNPWISVIQGIFRKPSQVSAMLGQGRVRCKQLPQQMAQVVSPWNGLRSLAQECLEIFLRSLHDQVQWKLTIEFHPNRDRLIDLAASRHDHEQIDIAVPVGSAF